MQLSLPLDFKSKICDNLFCFPKYIGIMFSQNQQNRYGNNRNAQETVTTRKHVNQTYKKSFYGNNSHYKKFLYRDITQKKGKLAQKKLNPNFNNVKYNFTKKNRNLYYANLLQKSSGFSLEEQMIFERLWKGALGQTFGSRIPSKQEKKNCCCHCQCGNSSAVPNKNETNKIGMLRSWMGDEISKKTMKSVVR